MGGGDEEEKLIDIRVSFRDDENILKLDIGDSCAIL